MNVSPKGFLVVIAMISLGLSSPGVAFTPNNLYVGGRDTTTTEAVVFEFDPSGNLVRTIPTGNISDYVYGLAFGPDGNLYAAVRNAGRVVRISPTYTVTTFVEGLDPSPIGVEFGPQGRMYVCSREDGGTVRVLNPDGTTAATYTADASNSPSFATFRDDGHVFVTMQGPTADTCVQELDASLRPVRKIGVGTFSSFPSPLVFGRDGVMFVADYGANQVQRFDATGAALPDLPAAGLSGPYGLAIGPDGNLYVANWTQSTDTQILVVNPATGDTIRTISRPGMFAASGMAFAPSRYNVRLRGTATTEGVGQVRLAAPTGVLSIAPGSGKTMISIGDPAVPNSIGSIFPGTSALVFHGNDVVSGGKPVYAAQGAMVSMEGPDRPVGSSTLTSKGAFQTGSGYFTPRTVSGSLQLSRPGSVVSASFVGSRIR